LYDLSVVRISIGAGRYYRNDGAPESTEKSNKAFRVAKRLNSEKSENYLRTLWINSVVGGHNIESEQVLSELASEVGYDTERFRELWNEVEVEEGEIEALPETILEINGKSYQRAGHFDFEDVEMLFLEFEEERLPSVEGYVEEYHPVTVRGIEMVCEVSREEGVNRLQTYEATEELEVGRNSLWTSCRMD